MKQGNSLINLVMFLLAGALFVYFAVYLWNGITDPYATTFVYEYIAADTLEADGYLVREEQLLPAQSGIINVTRSEGEKVGVGQEVALVHRDSQAVAAQAQLDQLEREISILDYALKQGEDFMSSARLDESILQSLVTLRASAALSDFTALEDQVLSLKSRVLKRDYTFDQDSDLSQLSAQRQALSQQAQALRSQSAAVTSRVTAPVSGTFSALVDGYESVLTPKSILELSPSQFYELKPQPVDSQGLPGKLITSQWWYFVTAIPQEQAQQLRGGDSVTLALYGDINRDVPMQVEQISAAEKGRCVLVLSSNHYLAQTALLRQQSAELVFQRQSGLRLPKTALHMISRSSTDEKTGKELQENILGVYAVVSGQAEFKPVEIISEGADYYVVRPANSSSRSLRAGEKIVLRARDLHDGKLLEY